MAKRKILVDDTRRELEEHGTETFPLTVNHDDSRVPRFSVRRFRKRCRAQLFPAVSAEFRGALPVHSGDGSVGERGAGLYPYTFRIRDFARKAW